jgi:nitroimidazol reductase NimA-like FMN-containing flavoprotein (pyridoxamine 5'-phosphate oxidase superfamily)
LTNVQQNPRVCLEMDWCGRWLPAKTALAFSVEYTGVVVFGRARFLEDPAEKERALQGLLDKYFPDLTFLRWILRPGAPSARWRR